MALSKTTTKAIWLGKLLEDLGFVQKNPTNFFWKQSKFLCFGSKSKIP
jgi:hypothetical protein